jgi:2-polyprenyl-6-methoxyphenol hydroxylase-like FAD-dependent oxidoreductase
MDPITGQGIADAFRDAELLCDAIDAGFGGRRRIEDAMADYQRRRDHAVLPMYDFTTELAALAPPRPEAAALFEALAGRQDETDRFLGVLTGAIPMRDYLSPGNLMRIIGLRRMAGMMVSRLLPARSHPATVAGTGTG